MPQPIEPEELPPIAERREPPRRRTLLGALVVSRDGKHTVECAIRNFSASGARIKAGAGQVIPKHAYVIVSGRDVVYESVVIWVGTREVGLRFLRALTLEDLTTPELALVRKLAIERLPRTTIV